jgi:EpsI family protein
VAVVLAAVVRARRWRRVALPVLAVVMVVVANALVTLVAGVLADREAIATMQAIVGSKVALVPGMALAGWAFCTALLFRPIERRLAAAGRLPAAAGAREATRTGGRRISVHLLVALLVGVIVARTFGASPVTIPTRSRLVDFPMHIGDWRGERSLLEPFEAEALQLDDYVLAQYRRSGAAPLSFYVAWYDSQQAGRSVHSPNSCLPGQGWKIRELESVTVDRVEWHGHPLRVNRAVIELAGHRQLLYYWFQQRGHVMTSEYVVKWRLFQDSLLRGRSDGALVRLVLPLGSDADALSADATVQEFLALAVPKLPPFVPE